MENISVTVVFTALLLYIPFLWRAIADHRKLSAIPTVGPSGFFTSYLGALRFMKQAPEVVQEGYDKYRGSLFKIPMMTRWVVVVTGRSLVEEFRSASDDLLSLRDAVNETRHLDVTVSPDAVGDRLVVKVIQTSLTKNLEAKFSDVQSEIAAAFSDYVLVKEDEWVNVRAFETVMNIVCRASNMMLVGLPLCRNPDYLSVMKRFTNDTARAGLILNFFPRFMRSIVARFLPRVARDIESAMRHLGPLIQERREQETQYGKDWLERPNDVISWFNDVTEGQNQSLRRQTIRLLMMNKAAIYTTSMPFTDVLFELAARPGYLRPMREEVESIIDGEGWSKAAIDKLRKVDSFIRETLRMHNMSSFVMRRKVMKDFTFSDGTTIPAGTLMAIPERCIHFDKENYDKPEIFDGFRFERMRKEDDDSKYRIESLDHNFVTFSQGRHACPGRFFASNELKMMLAYVLLNYDVRMAVNDGQPIRLRYGMYTVPNPTAEILFRKRCRSDVSWAG